uniref:Transposase n=1 Tax=Steinernema glaseri TaxID=37863 RepID=A0A1I7YZH2_9BILA
MVHFYGLTDLKTCRDSKRKKAEKPFNLAPRDPQATVPRTDDRWQFVAEAHFSSLLIGRHHREALAVGYRSSASAATATATVPSGRPRSVGDDEPAAS